MRGFDAMTRAAVDSAHRIIVYNIVPWYLVR